MRVGSGGCTKIGLSPAEIQIAEERFAAIKGKDKTPSDSAYLIKERRPLLMLHIINVKCDRERDSEKNIPEFLFALGVGFPDTGEGIKTANYMVNVVELRNWMDPDEENDE